MTGKEGRLSPKHHSHEVDERSESRRVASGTTASTLRALVSFLLCVFVHLSWNWNAVAQAAEAEELGARTNGICSDDVDSIDGSCTLSNDRLSNRVPRDCTLVMAPSGISGSGWGVFTLTSRKQGQRVMDQGDIIIHLPDPNPRNAHEMRRLIWEYLWDGQLTGGHYEGLHVMSISGGMGTLANGVATGHNLIPGFPSVDDAGLKRGKSPGAGAVSHHHNYTWIANTDLMAGDELLVQYGAGWFKERGFDGNASPRKIELPQLREVGYCLDNIVSGPSLIEGAGRGAFASRDLKEGAIVAPVPLIPLSRSSLDMFKERKDGTVVVSKQLLQNYCFGDENSSLLLYPYSHGVNYINHDTTTPNVQLRWWEGSYAYFSKPLLELTQSSTTQLMLELVATRPISKGEELYLDYGEDWEKAWNDYVESWQPKNDDIHRISADSMNGDDNFLFLRTAQEQQSKPYPEDIFTSCYYQYTDHAKGNHAPASSNSAPVKTVAKWQPGMIASRNLRPCIVVEREIVTRDHSYIYTVHVTNRPTLDKDDRIPKGHIHFVTHVPRHAIVFSDKTYTSDQHLENAFRKEIGLGDLFPDQWKNLL